MLMSMFRLSTRSLLGVCLLFGLVQAASGAELKISAQALERTLRAQLFNGANGRYYMRGDVTTACYVYADSPQVTFVQDRVVVHVHTRSKLGTSLRGTCVGISLATDADVSFIPDAEGESIGFRDARIERLSESKELNFLLVPFLSRKLPTQMKVNAADLLRKLLMQSAQTTGYSLTLTSLKIHSMIVEGNSMVVDVDTALQVD